MAVRWYYKVMGQEAGPVSASELKELVASGFLTPDVLLRKGDEGAWFPSGDVRGLYDDGSQAAGAGWYCQVMGREIGPLSPSALRELAASGFIAPGISVRKGIDGDWVSSDRVKGLFGEAPKAAARKQVSWYYEVMGEETGPLSTVQLRELAESGFITSDVLVRKGADGNWLPAAQVEGLFKKADKTAAALPPIPKPPPVPLASPPPAATLRDAADKAPLKPAPARGQAADAAWYYEAMGQKTGPLSSAALKELAASGLLTPDTRVRKGAAGNWVAAQQVKGLFERRVAAVSKQKERPAAAAPRPAAESSPEPLPESALELLPESALEPLSSKPVAGPAPVGGMGDLLDEVLSAPLPVSTGPALRALPRAPKPARKPRHVASSPFTADLDRPRKGRGPGMASRVLIGGFMTFIGGLGVAVWAIVILVLGMGLVGAGTGALSALPVAAAAGGVVMLLLLLAVSVVAVVASYYYLSGGIGVLQGKSAGADKGALASTMVITLEVLGVLSQFGLAAMASGQGAEQAAAAGSAVGVTLVLASFRCVMAGGLLWWCKTVGQNLPR